MASFMRVEGTKLVDGDGKEVILRGAGLVEVTRLRAEAKYPVLECQGDLQDVSHGPKSGWCSHSPRRV